MRAFLVAASMAFSTFASADQLVYNPTGKRVPSGEARLRLSGTGGGAWAGRVDFGVGAQYEVGAARTVDGKVVIDLSYNLTLPYQDVTPGISFGIMDVGGMGEAVGYFAATFAYGNDLPHNQATPTELTIGVWTHRGGLVFCGVLLPLTNQVRLLWEMGRGLPVAGIEYVFERGTFVRATTDGSGTVWTGGLSLRF